jgi:hypothetical protein
MTKFWSPQSWNKLNCGCLICICMVWWPIVLWIIKLPNLSYFLLFHTLSSAQILVVLNIIPITYQLGDQGSRAYPKVVRFLLFNCVYNCSKVSSTCVSLTCWRCMVGMTCGRHGTLMWQLQPQDSVRFNANFTTYKLYIVRIGCLFIWTTIFNRVAK